MRTELVRHRGLVAAILMVGLGLAVLAATSDVSTVGRLVGVALVALFTAGLVALSASDRAVRRGLAALVAGVVGVCAGGGVGPVWLATSGLSVVAIATLAALIAASLLVAAGTWLLVRATPRWWRLAAIPVAFLLLQFVLLPGAGAFYGTHPPRTPLAEPMPGEARAVSFKTPDGVTMAAWYTPTRNGAAVIVLPGSGGAKDSTIEHAGILAEHGFGVLALDSRGTGDSAGIGNAWGWHGPADVAGALEWLLGVNEVDPDRIGVLGFSMGGEVAITAAATDERISAVVAEGVSSRVPSDLAYLPNSVSGWIQRLDGQLMWLAADLMTAASPPAPLTESLAQASRVPVLILVGSDPDEASAAPLLRNAAPTVEVWALPDTPHIQALTVHPEEWEARVLAFLDRSLG